MDYNLNIFRELKKVIKKLKSQLFKILKTKKTIEIDMDDLKDTKEPELEFEFITKRDSNLTLEQISKLGYNYNWTGTDRTRYLSCHVIGDGKVLKGLVNEAVLKIYQRNGIKPGDKIKDMIIFFKNILDVVGEYEQNRGINTEYGDHKFRFKTFEDVIKNKCGVCNDLSLFAQMLCCRYGLNTNIGVGYHKTGETHAFLVYKDEDIVVDLNNLASKGVHKYKDYINNRIKASSPDEYQIFKPA